MGRASHWVVLKNTVVAIQSLRVGRVLGDSLGALGHGVLSELTGEDQADGRLDLAGGQGALLVVADQLAGLNGDALEGVVDERVHDGLNPPRGLPAFTQTNEQRGEQ